MPYSNVRRRLNVLFVMPPCLPTPPKGYGGIELVAAGLLPELERAGARVTLCTPEGSTVAVSEIQELTEQLYPIISHPYNDVIPGVERYIAKVMSLVWSRDYDVIHDFSGMLSILNTISAPLGFAREDYPPVIHTIHGPIAPYVETYEELLTIYKSLTYTAISNAQLKEAPLTMTKRTKVIYNGINPEEFRLGKGGERYLVLGRLCHDKGQDRLIQFAAANGIPLDVAGTVAEMSTIEEIEAEVALGDESKVANKPDFLMYKRIRHLIDGERIRFYGNVAGKLKESLLGGAKALIIPNRWSEPFGMVAIEAMASGTPVIAMGTGAMPELIKHGETGFLAGTFEELCEMITADVVKQINPLNCQAHATENFSVTAVAQQYFELYREVASPAPVPQKSGLGSLSSPLREMATMYEQIPANKGKAAGSSK